MGKWEKLVKSILNKNPNLRFEDLYKALITVGYEPSQPKSGSSHYTFRKKGCFPITIPKHAPLKKIYIELVSEIVQKYQEQENE